MLGLPPGSRLRRAMLRRVARTAFEAENRLVPLDTLDGGELAGLSRLVMAQPRPLAPTEHVALELQTLAGQRHFPRQTV